MRRLLLFLSVSLLFTACSKDDDPQENETPNSTPVPGVSYDNPQLSGENVTADFFGKITDENGSALSGVTVQIGNQAAFTNVWGFYQIDNATVDKSYAVIKATKDGYFNQFRSIKPRTIDRNVEDITLLNRVIAGTFESTTGGEVQIEGGAKVEFSSGTLTSTEGIEFNGTVLVASTYLNPTSSDIASIIPGDLAAVNTAGEANALITYGMIGVELMTNGGEALEMSDGMTATIHMPIQADQMSSAPETIPLWFFDENDGIWREDGLATKTGNEYVGEVTHFTFWNCDFPSTMGFLEGQLVTDSGESNIGGFSVKVTLPNGAYTISQVEPDGYFSGFVPAGEPLEVTLISHQCGTTHPYGFVDPIAAEGSHDMGNINIDNLGSFNTITFNATIVDCDNQPVQGLVWNATYDGVEYYAVSDGEGQVSFVNACPNESEMSYTIIDINNFTETESVIFTADLGVEIQEVGNVSFCDEEELDTYFTYTEGSNEQNLIVLTNYVYGQTELYGRFMAEDLEVVGDSASFFIENVPTVPGSGAVLSPGEYWQNGVGIALNNGNQYVGIFEPTESTVTFNEVVLEDASNVVLEADITISGTVSVSIYEPGNDVPIDTYSSTATCTYVYNPD